MSIAFLTRLLQITSACGHSFASTGGNDIYGNTRIYTSMDLASYADADITIYGEASPTDGALTRTETIPSGMPPTPAT